MIVSRTPFRVTLGGGGTDLPSYYEQHGGLIFAMGINKFMYVFLNRPSVDDWVRLHYTSSEKVKHAKELRHELAREALLKHNITHGIEISSLADISAGTGVGSSSCYLVGLLNAIRTYQRNYVSLSDLAEEACHIELVTLKKNIGKQDQYMATYGGLTVLDIQKDGKVFVNSINISESAKAEFVANTHIYYTGVKRGAEDILAEQDAAMKKYSATTQKKHQVNTSLSQIKELGYKIIDAIKNENFDLWGKYLDQHWEFKKKMSNKITLPSVERLYDVVCKKYNVLGGKIIGAGGGGFLMLYCPKQHKKLEEFMFSQGMPRLHYNIFSTGTSILSDFTIGM
ncbi:MAG: hypothetical protein ACD_46C00334G0001 [uncultured bacterium]|nr:MAG: hypothetical protein ACD_46C00334G0001 [uncultured bacterium]